MTKLAPQALHLCGTYTIAKPSPCTHEAHRLSDDHEEGVEASRGRHRRELEVQKTPETDAESALLDHVAEVRLFPLEEFIIIFFGRDVELVLRLRFGGFKRTREDAHLHVADFLCGTDGVARLLRLSDGRLDGVAAA